MSFSDPQSITIGATTYSLPKTNSEGRKSEYSSEDGTVVLSASSQLGKRIRRNLRVDFQKIAADPITELNALRSMSCYVVFDTPTVGFTNAEELDVYTGLITQANASTYAIVKKLLGGES
jgi:hypothetical protein